ncbi:MAG: hypothetical protein WAL71_20975 [Terriglobales bacterium]
MPRTARNHTGQRGSRVKLGGSILALVLLENGRQIHASLNQLSTNGGLLSLKSPLDESIAVTVLFHVGATTVRCRARMMFPMWATKGCLQPFRFVDLAAETRADLGRELENLVRANTLQDDVAAEYNDLLLRRL